MTIACRSSRSPRRVNASQYSLVIFGLMAFSFSGRFIVTVMTPSASVSVPCSLPATVCGGSMRRPHPREAWFQKAQESLELERYGERRGDPAVDHQCLPGDVARQIGEQEQDAPGHVFRRAFSAQRHSLRYPAVTVGRGLLRSTARCPHRAGRYRVDAYLSPTELVGERAG